jgi:hypothetical protein
MPVDSCFVKFYEPAPKISHAYFTGKGGRWVEGFVIQSLPFKPFGSNYVFFDTLGSNYLKATLCVSVDFCTRHLIYIFLVNLHRDQTFQLLFISSLSISPCLRHLALKKFLICISSNLLSVGVLKPDGELNT